MVLVFMQVLRPARLPVTTPGEIEMATEVGLEPT